MTVHKRRLPCILVFFLIIVMLLSSNVTCGAKSNLDNDNDATKNFKVVGYYSGDLFNESVDKLQTDKLTHIMYAFLIPNEDGTVKPLAKPEQLAKVTQKAHNDGAKVYIALGGWSYEGKPLVGTFEKVGANSKLRAALVKNTVNFVMENNLDGVEIDWEHPNANTIGNYEKLVVELAAALMAEGKSLTAAVNGAWSTTAGPEVSKLMTDKCLKTFEFISVMGYDMNNEEHSPLWFGNTSIEYWLKRGVEPDKIVLGMPLYGRPSWKQYRHLVEENESNAFKDYEAGAAQVSHYNGLNTLREKTRISIEKAGGVMLFDVNEDVDWNNTRLGKYSVVSMIDESIKGFKEYSKTDVKNFVTVVVSNKVVKMSKFDGQGTAYIDKNNRTMLPMRKLLESIDAKIDWSNDDKVATATKDSIKITVKIGDKFITVNGEEKPMDTVAIIEGDRTYLPARAVLEAFGYNMRFSGASKTVYAD